MKAWIALAMAVGSLLAFAAPAQATVTRTQLRASTIRTFDAPGCRLVDVQTLHEDVKGWLMDVNGATHVDLLLSGTVTFEELGQSFVGRYSLPMAMFQQPDGSFVTSGSYTAVAKGDDGDVAMLHHIVHVTFFAPDRLDTSISILDHTCS
jgi:hypothetical protein